MENNPDIEKVRNEVLRKLGRNLLVFQHIEALLKFFTSKSAISAYLSEFMSQLSYQQESVKKRMMGQLINPFLATLYGEKVGTEDLDFFNEIKISVSMTMAGGSDRESQHRASLEAVINERNDLVHHFFSRVQQGSLDEWLAAGTYLDRQREVVLPELNLLGSIARAFSEAMKEHLVFIDSDEWEALFKQEE